MFQTFSKTDERSVMKQCMVREFLEYYQDHRNVSLYRNLCAIAPKYGYSPEGLKKLLIRMNCLSESDFKASQNKFLNKVADYADN